MKKIKYQLQCVQIYLIFAHLQADKSVADKNALLVLENIKVKGFIIGDRANGFDKNDTEVILEVSIISCRRNILTENID